MVERHVSRWGTLCVGYERDPHFVDREDLCLDHMGDKMSRDPDDYQVLCRSCNGAKGGR